MKRKLILMACIATICLGCSNDHFEKIIDHHFAALNKHDLDQLTLDYSAEAPILSVSWDGAKNGPPQIRSAYARYFHTSPDLKYTITKITYGDNSATIEYESTGTMLSPEKGTPAYMNGKKYTLKNCTVMQFKDNKIVYESTYFDQVAFLRQVGFFDQPTVK